MKKTIAFLGIALGAVSFTTIGRADPGDHGNYEKVTERAERESRATGGSNIERGGPESSSGGGSERTTIDHEDGTSTTVETDSSGTRYEHSTGGGGQYGRGWTHSDAVREQTDRGSTVRNRPSGRDGGGDSGGGREVEAHCSNC
jgi:hypothetical protein